MRFSSLFIGIFLTAASFANGDESVSSCPATVNSPREDFSWLEDLSKALAEGKPAAPDPIVKRTVERTVAEKPKPKIKRPSPPAIDENTQSGAPEDENVPSGNYDMREPALDILRNASRASAAKCRVSATTGRKLCGIRVSKYLCYRGVKDALVDAGLVDAWWSEGAASDAHDHGTLEKKGFSNVIDKGFTSVTAPLGSVLVYSGGAYRCSENGRKKTCGHIEIKLNNGEYCSDYCKALPADGYLTRKLVGIYVKK